MKLSVATILPVALGSRPVSHKREGSSLNKLDSPVELGVLPASQLSTYSQAMLSRFSRRSSDVIVNEPPIQQQRVFGLTNRNFILAEHVSGNLTLTLRDKTLRDLINTFNIGVSEGGYIKSYSVDKLPNGGFVIVWHEQSVSRDDQSNNAVYLQRYDSFGNKTGEKIQVSSLAECNDSPIVKSFEDGGVIVAWDSYHVLENGEANLYKSGIYMRRYDPDNVLLAQKKTDSRLVRFDIAALKNNGFALTFDYYSSKTRTLSWDIGVLEYDANSEEIMRYVFIDGLRVNLYNEGKGIQKSPIIATLGGSYNSDYIIAWQGEGSGDDMGLFAQIISTGAPQQTYRDTNVIPSHIRDIRINELTYGYQTNLAIDSMSAKRFLATWESNAGHKTLGIHARIIDDPIYSGQSFAEARVSPDIPGIVSKFPTVIYLDQEQGGYLIVWSSYLPNNEFIGLFGVKYNCLHQETDLISIGCITEDDGPLGYTNFRVDTNLTSSVIVDMSIPDSDLGHLILPDSVDGASISDLGDRLIRISGSRKATNSLLSDIQLMPSETKPGNYEIPVTITVRNSDAIDDSAEGSWAESIIVKSINDWPELGAPIPEQVTIVNQSWSFAVPNDTFTDKDDKKLSTRAFGVNETELPEGINFDPTNGTFGTFFGRANKSGTYPLVVRAEDDSYGSVESNFDLVVKPIIIANSGRYLSAMIALLLSVHPVVSQPATHR